MTKQQSVINKKHQFFQNTKTINQAPILNSNSKPTNSDFPGRILDSLNSGILILHGFLKKSPYNLGMAPSQ